MVILEKFTIVERTNCVQNLLLTLQASGELKSGKILNLNNLEKNLISKLLLEICEDCKKMAALPQGAFAACKLRETFREREMIIARMKSASGGGDSKNTTENKKLMEYSPVKYNGKMMNSIWGHYNRYSPHNIKGNEYESNEQASYLQQHNAVASYVIAQNMTMAIRSGKEWRFMEK